MAYKMDTTYTCRCEKVCANYDEYVQNHVLTIPSWAEQMDKSEAVEQLRSDVEQMLRGEPYARVRRAMKAEKIASGYVPKPQPRCAGPKPICNKCVVDVHGKITSSNCFNKKCTFNHGPFDRRAHVRTEA